MAALGTLPGSAGGCPSMTTVLDRLSLFAGMMLLAAADSI